MAFSLKIEIELILPRKRKITIAPNWWRITELKQQYPFREECDGTYLDYYLETDFKLFKKIHREQLPYSNDSLYGAPAWQKVILPKLRQIDRIIANPEAFEKATINIFEWESGLN